MSLTDYLTDSALLLLVLRQVREARFDRRAMLLPLVIVGVVAKSYLHSLPTSGNDLVLIVALLAVGLFLGTTSGLTTRVRSDGGQYALVKAGSIAAALWVLGMGSRMAFAIWASSHSGGASVARFSVQHSLSTDVWTTALVLMALAEVVSRVGILAYRSQRAVAGLPRTLVAA